MTFATELRRVRESAGLSQTAMSMLCEIDHSTLSRCSTVARSWCVPRDEVQQVAATRDEAAA